MIDIDREKFPFSEDDDEFKKVEFRRFFRSAEAEELLKTGHAVKPDSWSVFRFDAEARDYIIERAKAIRAELRASKMQ